MFYKLLTRTFKCGSEVAVSDYTSFAYDVSLLLKYTYSSISDLRIFVTTIHVHLYIFQFTKIAFVTSKN